MPVAETSPNYVACVKISGERMAAIDKLQTGATLRYGINEDALDFVAGDITDARLVRPDYRYIIGMGGGNFWRGRNSSSISPHVAHMVGRISTAMNAVFLSDALNRRNVPSTMLLAPTMRIEDDIAHPGYKPWDPKSVHEAHQNNHVVIIAGGMGIQSDTSDSATVRAASVYREFCTVSDNCDPVEIDVYKLTKHDGVFTEDPENFAHIPMHDAMVSRPGRYRVISAQEISDNYDQLRVVDPSCLELMQEEGIRMHIAGGKWSLPEILRYRPEESVQRGIGTLVVPAYTEAVMHNVNAR